LLRLGDAKKRDRAVKKGLPRRGEQQARGKGGIFEFAIWQWGRRWERVEGRPKRGAPWGGRDHEETHPLLGHRHLLHVRIEKRTGLVDGVWKKNARQRGGTLRKKKEGT